jgi:hypothetical protein
MTYEHFKQELLQFLSDGLPADTRLEVRQYLKNNNLLMDGLSFSEPSVNVSPTIYLNPYYAMYQDGRSFADIASMILQCHQQRDNMDLTFFTDYTRVRQRIIYKLVNRQQNLQLLENIPYIPFLDLAIVFCYYLTGEDFPPMGDHNNGIIQIRNDHLNLWQVSLQKLYQDALENTPVLLAAELKPLHALCSELIEQLGGKQPELPPMDDAPLYVLTNQRRYLGAGAMLYRQLLQTFADELQDDLIILPSSIHEILLLPYSCGSSPQTLTDLVTEVNAQEVPADEILSDHVYLYRRADNKVCCA